MRIIIELDTENPASAQVTQKVTDTTGSIQAAAQDAGPAPNHFSSTAADIFVQTPEFLEANNMRGTSAGAAPDFANP